jgi:hypothetical protein
MGSIDLVAIQRSLLEAAKTADPSYHDIDTQLPWPVEPYVFPALVKLAQHNGFDVKFTSKAAAMAGLMKKAAGGTDWENHDIWLLENMSDASKVHTLIHEIGHVLAGEVPVDIGTVIFRMADLPDPRPELEAELTAGTAEMALNWGNPVLNEEYLANWATYDPNVFLAPPENICQAVRSASAVIIAAVETARQEHNVKV